MSATAPRPLLKRVPPGAWTALAWSAATAYSIIVLFRLPGEGYFPRHYNPLEMPPGNRLNLLIATVLAVAGSAWLRRRPMAALSLLLLGAVAGAMVLNSTEINFLQFLTVDVALCHIAATRPRRVSVPAAGLAIGVLVVYAAVRVLVHFVIGTSTMLTVALTVAVAWLIGDSARQNHEHAETLRAQAAAQAVTAERLRISRELHDMVAHSIGIIALQAGAARRVIETQPTAARDALGAIEGAGREALAGLRRMLGALRQAEPEAAGEGSALRPAPGLADLDRLAEATTAAGVRVELEWHGERRPLPPDIELSAYRIVQESITNVVRHSGTASCLVSIGHGPEELSIEVLDRGSGPGGPGREGAAAAGYGLVGMRERTALLHGEFRAGPRPEGGFRVAARLPLPVGVR
ncbi:MULTISPECIES: sensor histidine kinase [Streptacidiphilus]|uniref:histidine kinase n=1 Tax=Streptacidiphilus cavernicola TaxID=3342716 RepID=A0ABV6UJR9_9ACTN|nr:histidine kinase [Streptacidiphilus jeojiense]